MICACHRQFVDGKRLPLFCDRPSCHRLLVLLCHPLGETVSSLLNGTWAAILTSLRTGQNESPLVPRRALPGAIWLHAVGGLDFQDEWGLASLWAGPPVHRYDDLWPFVQSFKKSSAQFSEIVRVLVREACGMGESVSEVGGKHG